MQGYKILKARVQHIQFVLYFKYAEEKILVCSIEVTICTQSVPLRMVLAPIFTKSFPQEPFRVFYVNELSVVPFSYTIKETLLLPLQAWSFNHAMKTSSKFQEGRLIFDYK